MSGTEGESGADTSSYHLLVVDDDTRIRALLRRYLADHGFRITSAENAQRARRIIDSFIFDLIVLDVMMPGEDGVSFARAIRGHMNTPIILLTARSEPSDRIAGLEAGVDDYLPKPFEPRELVLRIKAILRRSVDPDSRLDSKNTILLGELAYDVRQGLLQRGATTVRLTGAESALMRRLARTPNAPVSRFDLISELNGSDGAATERAVDVQVTRLRRKLEPDPREPRYLQTVRGEGYMLAPDTGLN